MDLQTENLIGTNNVCCLSIPPLHQKYDPLLKEDGLVHLHFGALWFGGTRWCTENIKKKNRAHRAKRFAASAGVGLIKRNHEGLVNSD